MIAPRDFAWRWLTLGLVAVALVTWALANSVGEWVAAVGDFRPLSWAALLLLAIAWHGVRFLRWQFLLRRAEVRVPTRGSVTVYLAGLFGIATPLMAGEAIRAPLLKARYGADGRRVFDALATARALDVWVASVILTVLRPTSIAVGGLLVATILVGVLGLVAPKTLRCLGTLIRSRDVGWAGLATLLLWAMLTGAVRLAGGEAAAASSLGFSLGALTDASPLPVRSAPAIVGVAFLGIPTLLGLITLASGRWRRTETSPPAGDQTEHFDAIADEYLDQWSPHIWSHLIRRKVGFMADRLEPGMRGLDLGCGAGLQVLEMAQRGFEVIGIDPSRELVRLASRSGAPGLTGTGQHLPFRNDSLDFVYAVGVLHHVPGPLAQAAVIEEIRRVLKPGGMLLVHETNPRNPLFRFYMGYAFPILKDIDEGTEWWLRPGDWSERRGFDLEGIDYFTFIPDFLPQAVLGPFSALERRLERGPLRAWSVHYMASLRKSVVPR